MKSLHRDESGDITTESQEIQRSIRTIINKQTQAQINKIETRKKSIQESMNQSWFEKINTIDKP